MTSPRPATRPTAPAGAVHTVRVATYRRASTDEGNQPYSLVAQEHRLTSYIGGHEGWVHAADYVERASAKDVDGRAQLKKRLADAAASKFDVVLVARVDRWSRSLVDLLDTVEVLHRHDVAFHSASEHFDTATPIGRMLLQMFGMFAEFERSMIIDRIQRGNAAKLAKGIPVTRKVAYGLTVEPDTGRIAADPNTIGTVRRMFREYTRDQKGIKAIALGLNADRIPGPGGPAWSPQAVAAVLRNRSFIGQLRYHDGWLPGAHAPIIDPDTFATAQALADKRASDLAAAAHQRGQFLLSGVIFCARCGRAYVGTAGTSSTGVTHRYYSCNSARKFGPTSCDGPNLPANELEDLVTDQLLATYRDPALFDEALSNRRREHADRHGPLTEELDGLTQTIAKKERVRRRYQDDYESGELSAARYESRAAELDDELDKLRDRAAELQAELEQPDLPAVPDQQQLALLRDLLTEQVRGGDIAVRKALFEVLVDRIDVHDADDIRPRYRLYDPVLTAAFADQGSAEQGRETAQEMSTFDCHRAGWS